MNRTFSLRPSQRMSGTRAWALARIRDLYFMRSPRTTFSSAFMSRVGSYPSSASRSWSGL